MNGPLIKKFRTKEPSKNKNAFKIYPVSQGYQSSDAGYNEGIQRGDLFKHRKWLQRLTFHPMIGLSPFYHGPFPEPAFILNYG
jgi:hypothetical protein